MNNRNILLIPPCNYPIPAVKGGAVEQLITFLLEQNEIFGSVKFVVISKYDQAASKFTYKNSTVYYYDPQNFNCKQIKLFRVKYLIYKIYSIFFLNRISRIIFKSSKMAYSKYDYLCRMIVKKEQVDGISIEGQWEIPYKHLKDLINPENIYIHMHSSRNEDLEVRKCFRNSILLSDYLKNIWIKSDLPGNNIILRNCANTEIFEKEIPQTVINTKKNELGISTEDFVLIYCGRIVPIKGIDAILDAFSQITHNNIKLLLIGSSDFGNPDKSDYELYVDDCSSKDPRIIRLNFVENTQLPLYYAISDTMLFPSTCQEGAPLVPIEAMASGLPIIATLSGGSPEYISKECAKFLPIDSRLSTNLKNAILELYNNPEKREQMGKAGKERAKLYSKENYYKNFVKIFTE